jgi:DNA-binding NarL/FixJ family response regulator
LIDDERLVAQSAARWLRRHFEVEVSHSPGEALEQLGEVSPFDVVIADLRMEEMDGISLLSIVRERSPRTRRILLTGHCDRETAIRGVNEGGLFRLLEKPLPPEELEVCVRAALESLRDEEPELYARESAGADESDDVVKSPRPPSNPVPVEGVAEESHIGLELHRLAMAGVLAGAVGHELNNLLTVYMSLMEHLRAGTAGDSSIGAEELEDLEWVQQQLRAQASVLRDSIRPRRHRDTSSSLGEVLSGVLETLRISGASKYCQIESKLEGGEDDIDLPASTVRQLLLHMLLAALSECRESGRGRLELVGRSDPSTRWVGVRRAGGLTLGEGESDATPPWSALRGAADSAGIEVTFEGGEGSADEASVTLGLPRATSE